MDLTEELLDRFEGEIAKERKSSFNSVTLMVELLIRSSQLE
jgi:hypothetical protein